MNDKAYLSIRMKSALEFEAPHPVPHAVPIPEGRQARGAPLHLFALIRPGPAGWGS